MKCKLIRDDLQVSQAVMSLTQVAAEVEAGRVIYRDTMRDGRIQPIPFWVNGAVIEGPQTHWLVKFGAAIPADDACRMRAFMTDEQMQQAQYAQERTSRGISVDDFEKYDKGQIVGYNPDGSYVPGPNYAELIAELEALEEEEEDDEI